MNPFMMFGGRSVAGHVSAIYAGFSPMAGGYITFMSSLSEEDVGIIQTIKQQKSK